MENSNPRTPGLNYIEKPSKIIKQQCQNGGLRGHYILPFKGRYKGVGALASALKFEKHRKQRINI